jgi:hypothetical protein
MAGKICGAQLPSFLLAGNATSYVRGHHLEDVSTEQWAGVTLEKNFMGASYDIVSITRTAKSRGAMGR